MDGTFLSPREVSARYRGRIDVRTLANWRARGNGPPHTKVGGRVLYPLAALEEWEKTRTKTGKAKAS